MAEPSDRERLKQAYQALQDKALEPDDRFYFRLYDHPHLAPGDPVEQLATSIEFSSLETVQLFSGFRGTGKSTELRRLRQRLRQSPEYKVVLCDMQDYLNMTAPVDVGDFLLAAAGALSDALEAPEMLGKDPSREGFWRRSVNFLTRTKVQLSELGLEASAGGVGAQVKLNLKADPSFLQRLQEHMKLRLGAFAEEVHGFVQECLKALRKRHGDQTQLVVIFDSIEQFRGTSVNAEQVASSVETVFRGHAEKLRLPFVHVVYTVPPWLRLRSPGVGEGYDSYQQIPCVKVRTRDGQEFSEGLDALAELVRPRLDVEWLLGGREAFDELARASGGYLRDLFRLLKALLLTAASRGVQLDEAARELAIEELRNAYLGFSNEDARWLRRIDESGETSMDEVAMLHRLARFFDTHLVLSYRNGGEWYGVHPIIRAEVRARADAYDKRCAGEEDGPA